MPRTPHIASPLAAIFGLLPLVGSPPAFAQSCVPSITRSTSLALSSLQGAGTGDFNADGRDDLIIMETTALNAVQVRIALPSGEFAAPIATNFGANISGRQSIIADLDGDHVPDVLATLSQSGAAQRTAWFAQPNGTFTPGFDIGMNLSIAAIADLNSDGRPDLIGFAMSTPNATSTELRVWLNQGGRTFSSVTLGDFAAPGPVLVTDLDHDGRPDILVVRTGATGSTQCAFQGLPAAPGAVGAFEIDAPIAIPSNIVVANPVLIDVTGDGVLDLAFPSNNAFLVLCPGQVRFGRSLVFGAATNFEPFPQASFGILVETKLTVADLNHDGYPDIIRNLAFADATTTSVLIKFGSATSSPHGVVYGPTLTFPGADIAGLSLGPNGVRTGPIAGDFTGDGTPDILVNVPDSNPGGALPSAMLSAIRPGGLVIDVGPSPARVRAGDAATLSVTAHPINLGTPITYRWLKDGVELVESARLVGTRSPTLRISGTTAADRGVYSVEASTACETRTASSYLDANTNCVADIDDGTATGTPDGGVTTDDLLFFLSHFVEGC